MQTIIEQHQNTPKKKAIVWVTCFVIYTIIVTCIFRFWSAFLACYIFVLTIISSILYALVTKSNQPDIPAEHILCKEEFQKISSLLRYATAILSFISLMTTARGLRDFVFSENETWLAYLASFAVQAILVSFSLAYCHIHAAIVSVKTLSERGKSLMTGVLSIFLALSFVVSSSFSFSYIANNAYAKTWANDGEILIQKFLTESISDLAVENKRIGNLLYEKIKVYNESLSAAIKQYISTQDTALTDTTATFQLAEYTYNSDGSDHGYGLNNEIITSWKNHYPYRAIEIDGLISQFDSCVNCLDSYYNTYTEITENLNISDAVHTANWLSLDMALGETYSRLSTLYNELSSLTDKCNNLYISTINLDISPYRSNLATAVTNFKDFVGVQKDNIEKKRAEVQDAINGYSSNSSGTSLSNEIETLQKKIYILNTNYNINNPDAVKKNVDEIISGLSNILVICTNNDILSDETIAEILELEGLIAEYQNYIELSDQIESYTDTKLAITYNITEIPDDTSVSSGAVVNIAYDKWKSLRDQDFLQFFSLLKKLPSEPDQGESTNQEESGQTTNDSSVKDSEKYHFQNVLYEANIMRRDLLGKITDFERAFSYFKYDFTAMAFFSAFIAVFFDLGAFLTGCFMYGISHFEKKGNHNSC